MDNRPLKGRVSLVTGAGTRLGAAIARRLADEGSNLIVHYFRSERGATELCQYAESCGARGVMIQADLSQHNSVIDLASRARAAYGSVDFLVNNASSFTQSETHQANHGLLEETLAEWENSLALNARAPFFLIQQLAPVIAEAPDGAVINILDTSASKPFLTRAAHSISKCALKNVTEIAARTLNGRVRVNALELGNISPPEHYPPDLVSQKRWAGERMVQDAVIFILTNQFLTGETIRCCGSELLE